MLGGNLAIIGIKYKLARSGKRITPVSQVMSDAPSLLFVGEPTGSLLAPSCKTAVSQEAAQDQTIVSL